MRPRVWLAAILICLLQTGAIASMIAGRAMRLAYGREIVLDVIPVDPRDLLRGDYVRLNYSISTIRFSLGQELVNLDTSAPSAPVFVTLQRQGQPEDGKWVLVAASKMRPAAPETDDKIVLRGLTKWRGQGGLHVTYGIESYFVPEATGGDLEKAARDGTLKAVISVDRDGNAAIKGLIVGGVRHDESLF